MSIKQKDYLTIGEVASYLGWSTRFVDGLVRGEKLPGLEINGEWRFRREELVDWLNRKIQTLDTVRVSELENKLEGDLLADGVFKTVRPDRLSSRLPETGIALDIQVESKPELLKALVKLANQTGNLLDSDHLHASLVDRESLCSTALPGGLAICHPRRPLPFAIKDYLLCFLRTAKPIAFGAEDGESTSIFFLLGAPDDQAHLHGLARLARILNPETIRELKEVRSSQEVLDLINQREREISGEVPPSTVVFE